MVFFAILLTLTPTCKLHLITVICLEGDLQMLMGYLQLGACRPPSLPLLTENPLLH